MIFFIIVFYYFKDIIAILNHPVTTKIYPDYSNIIEKITVNNLTYLTFEKLISLSSDKDLHVINILFATWNNNSNKGLFVCLEIIDFIKLVFFFVMW